MTTEEAFLAGIREMPEDDVRRLVYAEWLDDRNGPGDCERAEFIRVQVALAKQPLAARCPECGEVESYMMGTPSFPLEYGCPNDHFWDADRVQNLRRREQELWTTYSLCGRLIGEKLSGPCPWANAVDLNQTRVGQGCFAAVRRGFVAEVRCTLADWCGGECGHCLGHGYEYFSGLDPNEPPCEVCHGSGQLPGIGPAVVRSHPVERVVVTTGVMNTQMVPGFIGGVWGRMWARVERFDPTSDDTHNIPAAVWEMIELPQHGTRYKISDDEKSAHAALSDAMIAWAKAQPCSIAAASA